MPSARQKFGIEGVEALRAAFKEVPEEIRAELLVPVVTAGGKVIEEAMRFNAPVDEGDLRDSMAMAVRRYPTNAIAVIGPDRNHFRNGKRPANYAHLVEDGHIAPDGTFVPGTGFARAAVEVGTTFAALPMLEAAERAFDKIGSKLERKYGHRRGT